MDYERIVSDAILETCAERRADFLRNALARARDAIATFAPDGRLPDPAAQRDAAGAARLAALLAEHGVELRAAANGDVYVPLAQPYGRFVERAAHAAALSRRRSSFPARTSCARTTSSAWTLPLMMGVTVGAGDAPGRPRAVEGRGAGAAARTAPPSPSPRAARRSARLVNAGLRGGAARIARAAVSAGGREWPAGTVFLDARRGEGRGREGRARPGVDRRRRRRRPAAEPLRAPRVGLYKPWAASMDEGWTRFVLEQYGFEPKTLDNKTVRAGASTRAFDAIVLPDVTKEVIATGKPKRDEGAMRYFPELPPEYTGGLEKEGAAALKDFVEKGGTLVALSSSTEYVDRRARPAGAQRLARASDFAVAGLAAARRGPPAHPVTYGLPARSPSSRTRRSPSTPRCRAPRWSAGCSRAYPAACADVLLSGWIRGAEAIARKAAAVALSYGKGKVVLLGFRAQHRAQTPGTFPFLFGALYWSTAK